METQNMDRKKYQVSLEQRRVFGTEGFVKIEGLLDAEDLAQLASHSLDLAQNRARVR